MVKVVEFKSNTHQTAFVGSLRKTKFCLKVLWKKSSAKRGKCKDLHTCTASGLIKRLTPCVVTDVLVFFLFKVVRIVFHLTHVVSQKKVVNMVATDTGTKTLLKQLLQTICKLSYFQ